jgi:hypothetical protein
MPVNELLPQTNRAHELYGDFWFNGEPVIVSALQGSVILVFFWDYAMAGSLRWLPYIQEWHRKYASYGLVTAGVHTPRFAFGREPGEVEHALERLDVRFPVVMDNEGSISARYGMRSWPTLVLVDRHGFVRVQNSGGGSYQSIERLLQGLLYETGIGEELPLPMEPLRETDREGVFCYRPTPEIHAGYLRGTLGNVEGYSPESVVAYTDPGIYFDGRLYANGLWENNRESLHLAPGSTGGQIIIDYQGAGVSGVLSGGGKVTCEIAVSQDDLFLTAVNRGDDVRIALDGKSFLEVKEPRLYSIVKNLEYGEHLLRLTTDSGAFTVYTFAFSTSRIPELISHN